MPTPRSLSEIKAALLHPSTTSHFEVTIGLPTKLTQGGYLSDNGVNLNAINQDRLNLLCCEATLPGSSLQTLDIINDYHGVSERHAYRRAYDDRIDLTFYVDANYYLPIRVFEVWMKYISQESVSVDPERGTSSEDTNYFYRFQYPDNYACSGLTVTKFEKSSYGGINFGESANRLTYKFIKSYPISISSMPVSYESSSLLKCTVSMTYIRYVIENLTDPIPTGGSSESPTTIEQSSFNSNPLFQNPEFTAGNSPVQSYEGEEIINAINSNQTPVESGLPYVGRNTGPLAP